MQGQYGILLYQWEWTCLLQTLSWWTCPDSWWTDQPTVSHGTIANPNFEYRIIRANNGLSSKHNLVVLFKHVFFGTQNPGDVNSGFWPPGLPRSLEMASFVAQGTVGTAERLVVSRHDVRTWRLVRPCPCSGGGGCCWEAQIEASETSFKIAGRVVDSHG